MAGTPHVIVRYEGRIWYVCVLVAFEQAKVSYPIGPWVVILVGSPRKGW